METTFFSFLKKLLSSEKLVAMDCKLALILNMCLYIIVNKLISFNYLYFIINLFFKFDNKVKLEIKNYYLYV